MKRLEVSGAVRPLYGSLGDKGLKEEHNLRACENAVLKKAYEPPRATRRWRQLHKEQLRDPYYPPNITRMIIYRDMRLVSHIEYTENSNAYVIFVGKPE